VLTILTVGLLIILGIVAVSTDLAVCYRILNAAPFHEHPQQSTVALDTNTLVRIYFFIGMLVLTFILQLYFLITIYNCRQYFVERRQYMKYCMTYSKPMETLNSAR
uniref:G_PROTEIN_RECEP_F1_2 domain-containing protein n=2 Tax=Bursaphelenchus xylophilus TaxID=6326 RepID=A0A1I7SMZ5_BURXY